MGDAFVVRHHEADTTLLVETAHDGAGLALQDLDHGALETAAAVASTDPHHHPVPVEQGLHLLGIEIEIVATVVGAHESESVLVADDPPGDEVAPVDDAVGLLAVAQQLSVALHGPETPLQCDQVGFLVQIQRARELTEP